VQFRGLDPAEEEGWEDLTFDQADLDDFRPLFIVITGILTLLLASPALSRLLVYPRTEFFTELWLLGPNRKAENYPFNISRNNNYSIFLGVSNRLGYCAYYLVEVKFRNQTQSAPSSLGPPANRTPSSLPSLYNITAFVVDEGVWERPLTFSLDYEYDGTLSLVSFSSLTLNGVVLNMNNCQAAWNASRRGFYGNLLFELWIYNTTTSSFGYHQRFVDLKLNMTVS
jgi:hypothetical protein